MAEPSRAGRGGNPGFDPSPWTAGVAGWLGLRLLSSDADSARACFVVREQHRDTTGWVSPALLGAAGDALVGHAVSRALPGSAQYAVASVTTSPLAPALAEAVALVARAQARGPRMWAWDVTAMAAGPDGHPGLAGRTYATVRVLVALGGAAG